MRISDAEVNKVLSGQTKFVEAIVELEQDSKRRHEDKGLIQQITADVINMSDREEMISALKAKIDAGEYNPTGDDIADTMIRRSIADRIR